MHNRECVDIYISAARLMEGSKLVSQLRKELQVILCDNYRAWPFIIIIVTICLIIMILQMSRAEQQGHYTDTIKRMHGRG